MTAELAAAGAAHRPESTKAGPETVFDLLLGGSLLSWAALGWLESQPTVPMVRWAISLLHVTVAIQILLRSPVKTKPSPFLLCAAAPALVIGGLALRSAAPLADWPLLAECGFVGGAALAAWSLLQMGRSFAILPARRAIVTAGPYSYLRHPAYAGELVMILACSLSEPNVFSVSVLALALPCIALRILIEENLLATSPRYRDYRNHVRFRLIPGIW